MNKTAKEIQNEQLDRELFRYCGPIFVAPALNSYPKQMIGNGTYALVDTGKRKLLITCCHVWDEYERQHDANSETILAISLGDGFSTIKFKNPKAHLLSCDRGLDLVVLKFEPAEINIPHLKSWFKIEEWPIPRIKKGTRIVTMGFPGAWRRTSGINCVFVRVAMPLLVTDTTEHSIAAFYDDNIQVLNDMKDTLGGMSGSPAYYLNESKELCLVGFTKMGVESANAPNRKFESSPDSSLPVVLFTHACFLQPDGSLASS